MNIEQQRRLISAAVLLTTLCLVGPLNAALRTIVVGEPDCGNCNLPPPLDVFNTTVIGSNFTMYDPGGVAVDFGNQPTQDIVGSFDDSKICFDVSCTDVAMTMATGTPTAFQGFVWTAGSIRVFGPGTYTIDTGLDPQVDTNFGTTNLGGNLLTMTVGPGQLGAHMLFDWNTTSNIDVVLVWDINGQFTEIPTDGFKSLGATDKTRNWSLASTDANANGIDGIPMVDGPFSGFHANFNLKFDIPLDVPAPLELAIVIPGGNSQECTAPGGSQIEMTAVIDAPEPENITSINWTIDETSVGFGDTVTPFLTVGDHLAELTVQLQNGASASTAVSVSVVDTVSPEISASLIDTRNGESVARARRHRRVTTQYSASDVCDPDPMIHAVVGVPAIDGGTLKVVTLKNGILLKTDEETEGLELFVSATDASGNTSAVSTPLLVE